MSNSTISQRKTRNATTFFGLTFMLSTPLYILVIFVPEMLVAANLLFVFTPMTAALILTFREDGLDGAKRLMKRSFDYKRITRKIWYAPILFFMPIVYLAAFWILELIGNSPPEPLFPVEMAPILLPMFFLMALGEEVGWMGYAYDPMEKRWNALKASLILGIVWFTWHSPIYFFAGGQTLLWAVGQLVVMVGFRILLGWIYNNTGKSLFAASLFHAVYNVSQTVIPGFDSPLGPGISAVLVIIALVVIARAWKPHTLTQMKKAELV